MKIHRNITIRGEVQGVGFRYYARKTAQDLGLTGFVMNQADGSVYAEAEGEENEVTAFIDWCRKGPGMAEVTEISITEGVIEDFSDFNILHYF